MATQVKHRRGIQSEIDNFTPAIAEIVVNTTEEEIVLGNGATQGGVPIPKKRNTQLSFDTLADALANTSLKVGYSVTLKERTTGNGGGGVWDVVLTSTVTPDTFSVVVCTGVPSLSLTLRKQSVHSVQQFGAIGDGVTDDTDAIIAAVEFSQGRKLVSFAGFNHLVTKEIALPSNTHLDFQGAAITDNVQTFWSVQLVRAAPVFFIYDVRNVTLANFVYVASPTRNTVSFDIPTGIINLGRQGTTNETFDITVRGINASTFVDHTIFVSVLGEVHDCTVEDINLTGDCAFGINMEYGIAPSGEDKSGAFGAHPYNIKVRNFRGFQNSTCRGFLRVAAAYNISFENCFGYNVKNFIYCWTGDRGIQRVDETVKYSNCCHYATGSFVGSNIATVIAGEFDGSTGDPLPVWTNRDLHVIFDNCFLEGDGTVGLAGLRYIGSLGKILLTNCTFKNNGWGIRTGGSTGIATSSPVYALSVRDCLFKENYQDVRLVSQEGAVFDHCTFKDQIGSAIPVSIETGAINNTFTDCNFENLGTDIAYVETQSGSDNNSFIRCKFSDVGASASMDLRTNVKVDECISNDLFNTGAGFIPPINFEGEISFTPSLVGSTSGSQDGTGKYIRQGGLVYFSLDITSAAAGRPVGNLSITGLPFAAKSGTKFEANLQRGVFVNSGYGFIGQVSASATSINLLEEVINNLAAQVTDANLAAGVNAFISVQGVYSID